MPQVFKNNSKSTLSVALLAADATLTVQSLDATKFPAPTAGDFFDLTLQDATNIEIVRITARTGGVMTIGSRAREGTSTPATFAIGTVASLRLTAAVTESSVAHLTLAAGAHAASAISNAPAGTIGAITVQLAINELDGDVVASTAAATAALNAHAVAADPHPAYATDAELVNYATRASVQAQTNTAFTTAGTSTAYTLTPTPAITAYTAGQSFFVNFNAASGAAPTLAISAVATPPNLVKQIADGTYANVAAGDITINHRSRVTLLSATQALVERPSFNDITPFSRTVLDDVDAPAWRATLGAGTGNGTVTGVAGTAPIVSSGGTAPVISIPAATASVAGHMTAAYATKLDGIAAGATVGVSKDVGVAGVGMIAELWRNAGGSGVAVGGTETGTYLSYLDVLSGTLAASATAVAGTWRLISGVAISNTGGHGTFQRIA